MADWSDEEDGNIDMVKLTPEKVDAVTDNEEIDDDGDKIDKGLPNDVCGKIQPKTSIPEIEGNLPDADESTDFEKSEKVEHVLELLEKVGKNKALSRKWKKEISVKSQLLTTVNEESKFIKETKKDITDEMAESNFMKFLSTMLIMN